jgi:hypothetical protein
LFYIISKLLKLFTKTQPAITPYLFKLGHLRLGNLLIKIHRKLSPTVTSSSHESSSIIIIFLHIYLSFISIIYISDFQSQIFTFPFLYLFFSCCVIRVHNLNLITFLSPFRRLSLKFLFEPFAIHHLLEVSVKINCFDLHFIK